jgi:hypothetical protein
MMTILVLFYADGYRNLEQFYLEFVSERLCAEFPELVSYSRFMQFRQQALILLAAYLQIRSGDYTGISLVDAAKL